VTDVADMSAVDRFDDWHDRHGPGAAGDRSSYRAPLPASPPGPGQQYRFEVDLDACTGCKACVTACHSLNGLDKSETWRSVGLIVGRAPSRRPIEELVEPVAAPVWQQHVTTACHHCLEPACLAGCPVEAYEKDPITGIVAHLDDQCIGCRYCMLTCPYEVPSFNERLGIVRKCDMCSDRLAVGEAPACVQGCPTDAIAIGLVSTAELETEFAVDPEARVVPTAPRSCHTAPTTVYLTRKPSPADVVAADDHHVVPAHNHPPLVAMLVLTQLSVGAFLLSRIAGGDGAASMPSVVSWGAAVMALGASVLHLGRPLLAWRALLGLRHSWLSREIAAFGLYAPLGGVTAAADAGWLPTSWAAPLAFATAVSGVGGVVCSAELYAVTGRPFWRLDRTLARFVILSALTGAPAVGLCMSIDGDDDVRLLAVVAALAAVLAAAATATFVGRHHGRAHPARAIPK